MKRGTASLHQQKAGCFSNGHSKRQLRGCEIGNKSLLMELPNSPEWWGKVLFYKIMPFNKREAKDKIRELPYCNSLSNSWFRQQQSIGEADGELCKGGLWADNHLQPLTNLSITTSGSPHRGTSWCALWSTQHHPWHVFCQNSWILISSGQF